MTHLMKREVLENIFVLVEFCDVKLESMPMRQRLKIKQ